MREVEFHALLLQCLHTDPALPEPATLARLGPDDWVEFLDLAIRHRVTGAVSPRLRTQQRRELVPEACRKAIEIVGRGSTVRMALACGQIETAAKAWLDVANSCRRRCPAQATKGPRNFQKTEFEVMRLGRGCQRTIVRAWS
jgi:hypothetical protein